MPLELAIAGKGLAHWLTTGLPLVIISPVLGLMLNVELKALGAVALTLAAGTQALTFIGLIGAALSVALFRGGFADSPPVSDEDVRARGCHAMRSRQLRRGARSN